MKMAHKLVGIGVFLAVICGLIGDFSIVHSALADQPGENILSLVEIIPLDDFEASGEIGGPFTPPSKEYQLTYYGEEDHVYCVIEKSADWLDLNPDWVRLDPCVPEIITVSLNETAETLPGGIYNDTLIFTIVDTGDEYTRDVILTVEASSGILEVTPLEGFEAAGNEGGPFEPASKEYQLTNVGVAPLFWGIDDPCEWLGWDETSGSLDPCESAIVTVSITAAAELLEEGTYYDTLRFNDLSNNVTYTRSATLSIINIGGIWVEPESFDEIVIEGTHLAKTLIIGNNGTEEVDYTIQTRIVGGSGDMAGTMAGGADDGDGDFFPASIKHNFTELGTDPYKPGELIVRFASKAGGQLRSLTEKNDILKSLGGGSIERNFTIVPGLSFVKLPAGLTVEEALVRYNKTDRILYAQPNYEVRAISTFPDDTRFNDLWGMHNTGQTGGTPDADIDAPEAWDIATGGSEIVVAVIDTGVDYTHPDLAGNMWVNQQEFEGTPGIDDDGNGYVDDIYGYDFCNNDGNPMDDHYHGTHCAGTVGATGNNGEGVAGVCWNVRIMAVKFLDSGGSGWTSDAIYCVEYCTLMGANVMSNSWGGGSYSQGLKDAIDAAGAAGILFVAAAGNDYGNNNDTYPHYPSSYTSTNLIAVMSTDKYDNMSSFSNYGPTSVDLGAPGTDILSCQLGGGYKTASGTSMATPHVAGACALLWSVNPALSDQEVKDMLLRTVDPTLGGLCVSQGRLNIYNSILETSAPWLDISPEEGTLPPLDACDVIVTFKPDGMEPGVYGAEILIISSDPLQSTIIVPVTMTLVADDLALSPDEDFESGGVEGGPFMPQCMNYTLTNNGNEPVSWTTAPTADWLDVAPASGVLDPCDTIGLGLCISPQAELLQPGVYTETLTLENLDSGSIKTHLITLTVIPPDSFTESFGSGGSDLHNLTLTLRPDGSSAYYAACYEEATQFPTDPCGGTDIALGDDDFAEIILNQPAMVSFYGQSYDRIYIGSNGYITFGQGDVEYEALLENHFALPRISAMFADLTPPDGRSISWKQLDDRLTVTYENIPIFGDKQKISSFQIEIFFTDETIRITRLNLAATSSIMGISRGTGIPAGFFESDLSEYLICCPCGDFDGDYTVNLLDFAILAANWLDDTCESPYWCDWTDIDRSNVVDPPDLACLSQNWLYGAEAGPDPELIAYWKFDEGEGNTAYDSVGDNHGTLYGDPCWIDGKIGPFAIDFDGVDGYVDCGNASELAPCYITISVWIKTADAGSLGMIVAKDNNPENPDEKQRVWQFRKDADNHISLVVFKTNSDYASCEGQTNIADGQWHHVAGTWDENIIKVYVDGQLDGSVPFAGSLHQQNNNVFIGKMEGWASNWYFKGLIDDVRIYDQGLTAEEIRKLYEQGAGPIAHWKFDEGEGDTAYDSVGDNHGTLYGDPYWIGGKIGPFAIDFDGNGDYVRTSYEGGPSEYTVALWYNLNEDIDPSTFTGLKALASKTADEVTDIDMWMICFYADAGLIFRNEKTKNIYAGTAYKPDMFHKNQWHHIVATGTGTQGKLYFNGELKDTSNDNFVTGAWDDSVPFDIARPYIGTADRFFNGKIDDVRVYDRVLSAEEIQALYQTTVQSVGQDSQYYWSEPVLLEELNDIPNGKNAYSPCLSQDGLTMFFGRRSFVSGKRQIVEAYRDTPDGPFTTERAISELDTGDNLYSPWISNDELRLYYGRYENGTTQRMAQRNSPTDIWTDVKGFYEIHVGGTADSHTTLMPDELTMFYYSSRDGSDSIWTTTRESLDDPFITPTPVSKLNDGEKSGGPCIFPDGLTIYFYAVRDGHATSDIYKAIRPSIDVPFGNIERISISTDIKDEYCPYVTPDEKTLYFHTDQGIFVSYWEKDEITVCLPR